MATDEESRSPGDPPTDFIERRVDAPRYSDMLLLAQDVVLTRQQLAELREEVAVIKGWKADTTAQLGSIQAHLTNQDEENQGLHRSVDQVKLTVLEMKASVDEHGRLSLQTASSMAALVISVDHLATVQAPLNVHTLAQMRRTAEHDQLLRTTMGGLFDFLQYAAVTAVAADVSLGLWAGATFVRLPAQRGEAAWGGAGSLLLAIFIVAAFASHRRRAKAALAEGKEGAPDGPLAGG